MSHGMLPTGKNVLQMRDFGMKCKGKMKRGKKNGSRYDGTLLRVPFTGEGKNVLVKNGQEYHAPKAPRNTTSYIIQSKSMPEATALLPSSPCSPCFSSLPTYSDQLTEEVKEWGLNGYGSMNGLIREKDSHLKETKNLEMMEDTFGAQSLQQFEQRMDEGVSRFEMVYPCYCESQVMPALKVHLADKAYHIAVLEEENVSLKEHLSLVEQELSHLRSRVCILEGGCSANEFVSECSG